LQSINIFWLFFILKVAWNIVFAKVVADVRSDDEDESGLEKKVEQGEGYEAGISGGKKTAKALEGEKMNGVKMANGHASGNYDGFADAVVEGKKQR